MTVPKVSDRSTGLRRRFGSRTGDPFILDLTLNGLIALNTCGPIAKAVGNSGCGSGLLKRLPIRMKPVMNPEDYKDLLEPFDKMIRIEINGVTCEVPDNNLLLRCFQFLSIETISFGDFCWNGDCANCQVWLESSAREKPVLSCRIKAADGMKIVRMADAIRL